MMLPKYLQCIHIPDTGNAEPADNEDIEIFVDDEQPILVIKGLKIIVDDSHITLKPISIWFNSVEEVRKIFEGLEKEVAKIEFQSKMHALLSRGSLLYRTEES